MTAVVALFSISGGVQRALSSQLERLGPDMILILPEPTPHSPSSDESIEVDPQKIEKIPGVLQSGWVLRTTLAVSSNKAKGFLTGLGLTESTFSLADRFFQSFQIAEGRLPNSNADEVLLTHGAASSLQLSLGDSLQIQGRQFQVVGLLAPTGDQNLENSFLIEIERLWQLKAVTDQISFAWVRAAPDAAMDDLESALRSAFASSGTSINIQTPGRLKDAVEGIFSLIRVALGSMAGIAIFVGVLGLTNTMFMAVLERTREIGVFVALGAKRSQIINLFMVEAATLGLVGGILGLILGASLSASLTLLLAPALGLSALRPDFNFELMLIALLLAVVLGVIAGALPARRAAGLRPVEALRYE
ncbi:ABC transporter permease [Candidatus Acetothermia bacterium]|nr:ABC transporter permease [Candidatus Acetothermia bacterium]MBI3643263.1 ABC transporter permease [Candidatus Acetothermia bacterium]